MLSIGFFEILVIAVLGLLVFGPEKLPDAIRTFAFGISKAKRSWNSTRRELEQELGMDEIRREIHNAQVMEDLEKLKDTTKTAAEALTKGIEESEAFIEDAAPTAPAPAVQDDTTDSAHAQPHEETKDK